MTSCSRPSGGDDRAVAQVLSQWSSPLSLSARVAPACDTIRIARPAIRCSRQQPLRNAELAILAQHAATLQTAHMKAFSAASAHALGLIELVTAEDATGYGRAIALLRDAAFTSNPAEGARSDLAAALLALYAETGELRALLEAVDETSILIAAGSVSPPVCWNHVVGLAWLGARDQVARAHAQCTNECPPSRCAVPVVLDEAPRVDADSVNMALDGRWPAHSWDYATTVLLPRWARSERNGSRDDAKRAWNQLERVSAILASTGTDSTVARTLSAIRGAAVGTARRATLTRALELYGDARSARPAMSPRAVHALVDTIQVYTAPDDPVRHWVRLFAAAAALSERRLDAALAQYRALDAGSLSAPTVIGSRVALGFATVTMAQGDQVRALGQYEAAADSCLATTRAVCQLSALVMASRVSALVGDDERAERLAQRALAASAEPISQWRWSLLSAMRRIAESYQFRMTTDVLQQEVAFTAAALQRPDLEVQDVVQHASDMARMGDTARLRRDVDRLSTIYANALSPADQAFSLPDLEWIRGEYLLATGRAGARALLDSAVAHLRSEPNFARQVRPRMTQARALAFEGDTVRALSVLDSLLRALNARSTKGSTLFERARLADNAAAVGATAAAFLRQSRNAPATFFALSGKPFLGAQFGGVTLDSSRVDVAIRRLGDSVHVWSRLRDAWHWRVVRLPAAVVQEAVRSLDQSLLADVYDSLLRPTIDSGGARATHLRIDARGDLAAIPWSALYDRQTNRYVMERLALAVTDDILRAVVPARPLRNASLLLIDASPRGGRRDLPGARTEIEQLRRSWSTAVRVLDGSSGADRVVQALSGFTVVHFAGHAVLDAQRPERSYLELPTARPSQLTGAQLTRVPLHQARLVVLAACDTRGGSTVQAAGSGAVRATRGTLSAGLESLGSSFREAGAEQVIGAAWPIHDRATAGFMQQFYIALRAGADPVRALQQAQQGSLRSTDPILRSPRVWAAFQLLGS